MHLLLRMTLLILGILDPGICAKYIELERFSNIFPIYNFTKNFCNRNLRILEGIKHPVPLLSYKEEGIDLVRHSNISRWESTVVIDEKGQLNALGYAAGIDVDYIDGWDGMGWDGWSGNFFFWPISRKLLDIFFKLVRILLKCVSRYFWRKTQKISKKIDFSKIFAKIGGWFFFDFLNINSQISRKLLDIFF